MVEYDTETIRASRGIRMRFSNSLKNELDDTQDHERISKKDDNDIDEFPMSPQVFSPVSCIGTVIYIGLLRVLDLTHISENRLSPGKFYR